MNTTMHDLLASAVEGRERSLAHGTAFADEHGAPVRRTIQVRRVVTYAGTGTVAAVATVGVGFGVQAWAGSASTLTPWSNPSGSPSVASVVRESRTVTLVQVPIDESVYEPGETDRLYVYYASLGATDMIPFPNSGISYPGIPDVPSDAVIVLLNGDARGYDYDAPGSEDAQISAGPAWTDKANFGGDSWGAYGSHMNRLNSRAAVSWDVIGQVSSTTKWGIHYFLVDGNVVTEEEGRSNPAAIEVTAMFDPSSAK